RPGPRFPDMMLRPAELPSPMLLLLAPAPIWTPAQPFGSATLPVRFAPMMLPITRLLTLPASVISRPILPFPLIKFPSPAETPPMVQWRVRDPNQIPAAFPTDVVPLADEPT